MVEYFIDTANLRKYTDVLRCGDRVFLSGTVYTARDAAHRKITEMLRKHELLPFEIEGAVIYYAGPTPTRPDGRIGSFGPTTSARMDVFTPALLDAGLAATVGKGNRSDEVVASITKNSALYFCAEGGMGALISESIVSSHEIAFPELGPESIKRLEVKDFSVITAIDAHGNSVFKRKR